MSTKYIVIPSLAIGGAEKRFFDLFCALFDADNTYYLVLPQALHEQLSAQIELPKQYASNIIVIGRPGDSLVAFCIKYWAWLNKNVKGEAIFHYPINCLFPFHFFRKHSVSVSLTHCYAAPAFFTTSRSLFRQRLTMLFVKKVDV